MLKNEFKTAVATMGMFCIPLCAETAPSINNSQEQVSPSYVPGEKIKTGQLSGGYDQTASYICDEGWDVYITADYIYWKWQQDFLQLGTVISQTSANLGSLNGNAHAVFQNPGYKSGFQVGIGFNMPGMDDWHLYSEYTWYRNTDNNTLSTSSGQSFSFPGSHFQGLARLIEEELSYAGTITSKANLGFQSLDFLVERPFYLGKKLTTDIGFGLRAQWISQKLSSSSPILTNVTDFEIFNISNVSFVSRMTSWGLGPKFILNTNWLLGYGIKALAKLSASVLYTQYNTTNDTTQTLSTVGFVSSHEIGLDNYGTLRPVTEAFLGLAWGSYFCSDRFHMDLSVGYDFNVFWDYNVIYATMNQTAGNMYLHGMNIQLRFDF